jgi:hypothetical protein
VRFVVGPDGVAARPDPPPHGRCPHLVYLEGDYAAWQGPQSWACSFRWYHLAFPAVDPHCELRDGILTGLVNLYPSREVFRPAEPFEVVVSAVGRSNGQPAADHDLLVCALFAPDVLACVRGVLAVDPRHRHA